MTVKKLYINYLDSVRGLAAFSVFLSHFCGGYGKTLIRLLKGTPFSIFVDGYGGVSVFFVLSGLVLSLDAFHGSRKLSIVAFYIRRFFRITVPFATMLVIVFFAFKTGYIKHDTDPHISNWLYGQWADTHKMDFLSFLQQAALIIPGVNQVLIPQSWTLFYELRISLLMPFLILIAMRSTLWLTLFVIVNIAISETHFFLLHFFWGILLAKYHYHLIALGNKMNWLLKIPIFAIGIILVSSNRPIVYLGINLSQQTSWILSGLGAALLLALFTGSNLAKSILGVGVLRFLGRISYSMYLLHAMVLITITPLMIKVLNYCGIAGSVAYWLVIVPTLGVVLLISSLSFHFIEKPSISMGRFVAQKYVDLRNKILRAS